MESRRAVATLRGAEPPGARDISGLVQRFGSDMHVRAANAFGAATRSRLGNPFCLGDRMGTAQLPAALGQVSGRG